MRDAEPLAEIALQMAILDEVIGITGVSRWATERNWVSPTGSRFSVLYWSHSYHPRAKNHGCSFWSFGSEPIEVSRNRRSFAELVAMLKRPRWRIARGLPPIEEMSDVP